MVYKEKRTYLAVVPFYPPEVLKTEDYFLYPAQVALESGYDAQIFSFNANGARNDISRDGLTIKWFRTPRELFGNIPSSLSLLHCHGMTKKMFILYILLFLSRKKTRKLLTPHTSFGILPPFATPIRIHSLGRFIFDLFDGIISLSPFEKDFYEKKRFKRSYESTLAIDYGFFSGIKESEYRDSDFERRFGLDGASQVILFMGGNRAIKNPRVVLEAFNGVREAGNPCKLIVVDCIDTTRSNLDDVVLPHYRKDVFFMGRLDPYSDLFHDVMKASDIFVNSSKNEGFALGVAEAAAVGMALCLSDIGTLRSLYGNSALYHHPSDFRMLRDNLLRYLKEENLREQHVRANKDTVKVFDLLHVKHRIREIFDLIQ